MKKKHADSKAKRLGNSGKEHGGKVCGVYRCHGNLCDTSRSKPSAKKTAAVPPVKQSATDVAARLRYVPGVEIVDILGPETIHLKSWRYADNEDGLRESIFNKTGLSLDIYCDGDDWFVVEL